MLRGLASPPFESTLGDSCLSRSEVRGFRPQSRQQVRRRGTKARDVAEESREQHRAFQRTDDRARRFVRRVGETDGALGFALFENARKPHLIARKEFQDGDLHRFGQRLVFRGHHPAQAHSLVTQDVEVQIGVGLQSRGRVRRSNIIWQRGT